MWRVGCFGEALPRLASFGVELPGVLVNLREVQLSGVASCGVAASGVLVSWVAARACSGVVTGVMIGVVLGGVEAPAIAR